MDFNKYAAGNEEKENKTQQRMDTPKPSNQQQGGWKDAPQGGNKPKELVCYKSGMAAAKLLQWGEDKPGISLEVRTFDPGKQKSVYKNIQTSSLDAIVNLHKCTGFLIEDLIRNGYQLKDSNRE